MASNFSESSKNTVVVIGAGIVGVSTAIWLQRFGKKVILVDQNHPGEGTSFGNAGILASSSNVPVTAPKMIPKIPRYLMNPEFPLFMIWSYFPTLFPFLVRYLLNANDADTRRISKGLTEIVSDSIKQHHDLSKDTLAEKWVQSSPYVYAYTSREKFLKENYVWSLRRDAGFIPKEVEGQEVHDFYPEFSKNIKFLAILENHGFILNPGEYVKDLSKTFTMNGGKFIQTKVMDFILENETIQSVETETGQLPASQVVITGGIWSKFLMEKLDLKVPMETERGYHVVFESPSDKPPCPVMVASGKFVITPMSMGLRCAGTLEFGGLTAPPSKKPLNLINQQAKEVIPQLSWKSSKNWLGHRPAPSDSLPFIGEVRKSGIYVGFGHHHIGLTSGPKTGRALAHLMIKNESLINLETFSPMRFSN